MSQTAMSRTLEDSGVDSRIVGMHAVSLETVFYVLLLALAAALRLVALDGLPNLFKSRPVRLRLSAEQRPDLRRRLPMG